MLRSSPTSFTASEIIPAGARVKFSAGSATNIELADEADVEIGTAILHSGKSSYAVGEAVGVQLISDGTRTRTCIAASAITKGAVVKRANDGKVNDAGSGDNFGIALDDVDADGDYFEVLQVPGLFTTVADAAVTTAKVADSNITAAKLANAVADAIPSVTVGVVDTGVSHTATVTIQLKDVQGNNLAVRGLIRVFFSATSYGAPTDLGTVTATTGQVLKADTTDALLTCNTDANGTLVLSHVLTGAGNLFAHAAAGGLFTVGNAAIA